MTPAWEKEILKTLTPKFDKIKKECNRLRKIYGNILNKIPEDIMIELTEICFDIEAEDILNLVKEYLNDQK